MTILPGFTLPASLSALPVSTIKPLFIAFLASKDPQTQQSWCPDVRAALPVLDATFGPSSSPDIAYVEVGQVPEWRDRSNVYRTKWNVNAVPTLIRYDRNSDGLIQEVGRLVEGEILDQGKLTKLIA